MSKVLIVAFALFFTALLTFAVYASKSAADAQRQVSMLTMQKQSQQKHIELLTNAVNSADKELQRMRKVHEQLAAINAEYELKIAAINKHHADLLTEVSKLELSKDETVISWTNVLLPADVVSVLKHKTSRANHSNKDGNTVAANEPAINGLQAAGF